VSSSVTVLDDEVNNIKRIDDEAEWAIRLLSSRIGPETECREQTGDQRVIECDLIEHCTIRAIVHCSEGNFEVDGFGHVPLRDNLERDECHIIHVRVIIDSALGCEWRGQVVGDCRRNILET